MKAFLGCRVKCNTHEAIVNGKIINPGFIYGYIVKREWNDANMTFENMIRWNDGTGEWYLDGEVESFLAPNGVDVMVHLA